MFRLYRRIKRFFRPQLYLVVHKQPHRGPYDQEQFVLVRRTFLQHFLLSKHEQLLLQKQERDRVVEFDSAVLMANYGQPLRWMLPTEEVRAQRVAWIWHRTPQGESAKHLGFAHRYGNSWKILLCEIDPDRHRKIIRVRSVKPCHVAVFALE